MENNAVIRKLTVSRFRGIEKLEWMPAPGMNIILGGGDVGKTTILEAIALLLTPQPARPMLGLVGNVVYSQGPRPKSVLLAMATEGLIHKNLHMPHSCFISGAEYAPIGTGGCVEASGRDREKLSGR